MSGRFVTCICHCCFLLSSAACSFKAKPVPAKGYTIFCSTVAQLEGAEAAMVTASGMSAVGAQEALLVFTTYLFVCTCLQGGIRAEYAQFLHPACKCLRYKDLAAAPAKFICAIAPFSVVRDRLKGLFSSVHPFCSRTAPTPRPTLGRHTFSSCALLFLMYYIAHTKTHAHTHAQITAAMLSLLKAGDNMLVQSCLYGEWHQVIAL